VLALSRLWRHHIPLLQCDSAAERARLLAVHTTRIRPCAVQFCNGCGRERGCYQRNERRRPSRRRQICKSPPLLLLLPTSSDFCELQHASTTGCINSAFGLSAFFFSTLARELFPGRTGAFLNVLCFGTGGAVLLGALLIRASPPVGQVRLDESEAAREEDDDEQGEQEQVRPVWTEQTPLRTSSMDESVLYGERNPWASLAGTPAASGAGTPSAGMGAVAKDQDVHGLGLLRSLDFWIIFGIVGCCECFVLVGCVFCD
jgi:hypothetical protein